MKSCCRALHVVCVLFAFQLANAQTNDTIRVQPGWNLLSLPVKVADARKSVLFPTATSPGYVYNNGYVQKDTLEVGPAFWLKFGGAETIVVSGQAAYVDSITVHAGWNMIGALTNPIAIGSVRTVPVGIVSSPYYFYASGYLQADTLQPGKGYWVKAAQDAKLYSTVVNIPCPGSPTVTYASKTYNTVQMGYQCWLNENLNIGTRIDGSQNQTNNSAMEKYCYNNDTANCRTYGGFYQWNEAMQYSTTEGARGICPTGWHIPTQAEFKILATTVNNDGNALKAVGQGTGGGVGTNTSGFSSLLAGIDASGGGFDGLGSSAFVWSSTEYNSSNTFNLYLDDGSNSLSLYNNNKNYGFTVRCLKDFGEILQAPSLSSPPNGSDSIGIPPTVIWHSSSTALSYTLQVSADSLFSTSVYNQSGLSDTIREVNGLIKSSTYYWRVRAGNNLGSSPWSSRWSFTTVTRTVMPCPGTPTVTYAGKTYNTVQIETQCWLKENLDVGTMVNGSGNQSDNGIVEKYCFNDDTANCRAYGGLYQWNEAMMYSTVEGVRGICPPGWHIPSRNELDTLRISVGGDGNALKAIGQGTFAGVGTNTSGFSALLSGARNNYGNFGNLGYDTSVRSSSKGTYSNANYLNLDTYTSNIYMISSYGEQWGFSVRCIKD